MKIFNLITYLQEIAETHKDIQHASNSPHFFRVAGIGQLDQFIAQINRASSPAICADVNPDGQIISSLPNNSVDVPTYRFYVLKYADAGNFESIQEAKVGSKTLGFKILAKLSHDKHQATIYNADNGLQSLDLNFQYQVIGPLAQNWFGCMFTIRLQQSAIDAGMKYEASDYAT
jgi:hypothetical protein